MIPLLIPTFIVFHTKKTLICGPPAVVVRGPQVGNCWFKQKETSGLHKTFVRHTRYIQKNVDTPAY